jgi:mono/diheme cytochrome c family protein
MKRMDERNKTRARWSLGTAAAFVLIGAATLALVMGGGFDATASNGYPQAVSWAIHQTMVDSVRVRASAIAPPARFSQAQVLAGFRTYDAHCVMCHGGPGIARQDWTAGMHPAPPYLLDASQHWRPAELYFVVDNGVKMTGMPAWGETLSKDDIWNLVAFLEFLPNMTPADYARLRAMPDQPVTP